MPPPPPPPLARASIWLLFPHPLSLLRPCLAQREGTKAVRKKLPPLYHDSFRSICETSANQVSSRSVTPHDPEESWANSIATRGRRSRRLRAPLARTRPRHCNQADEFPPNQQSFAVKVAIARQIHPVPREQHRQQIPPFSFISQFASQRISPWRKNILSRSPPALALYSTSYPGILAHLIPSSHGIDKLPRRRDIPLPRTDGIIPHCKTSPRRDG